MILSTSILYSLARETYVRWSFFWEVLLNELRQFVACLHFHADCEVVDLEH